MNANIFFKYEEPDNQIRNGWNSITIHLHENAILYRIVVWREKMESIEWL